MRVAARRLGQVDRLHHPQAQRGQGDRRPDHRDPARPHRRHRHARHQRGGAGRDDGRPLRASSRVDKAAGPARRAGARGRRPRRRRRPRPPRGRRRRPDRARAARCSASPACRATARPSWSRRSWACARSLAGTVTLDGAGPARPVDQGDPARRASATCPRTAASTGWSRSSPSPRTWCSTSTTGSRSARGWALRPDAIAESAAGADRAVRRAHRRPHEPPVGTLSGGNQQKVIVAREMSRPLKLLRRRPADPRRRRRLDRVHPPPDHRTSATIGTAVLLVSSELDEVLALADRIAVMYRGRIIADRPAGHPARGDRPADGGRHDGGAGREGRARR